MQLRNIVKNLWPIGKADSSKCYDYKSSKDETVYGVYHIFCVNAWRQLVAEQIAAMQNSGLMAITDKLFISCIYSSVSDLQNLKDILNGYPVRYEVISAMPVEENKFEFPALKFIHGLSMREEFYVYYFHTKGVSYTQESAGNYPSRKLEKLNECSAAWRKMMEHFVFYKYNVALNVLKEYDAYGCKYDDPIVPPFHYKYYAGNFWWSKSSYIRTLPEISEKEEENRYWAENWVLLNADKIFSAFNTPTELYAVEIPRCVYTSIRGGRTLLAL